MTILERVKRKAIDFGFYKIGKSKLCIATYHGVDVTGESRFNSRFFAYKSLESHLLFFKKNFHSVSLEDIQHARFKKGKINIHLTFDDGYLNNYKYALPLLEKYKQHATIYVTGIHRTENKILWADLLDICPHYLGDSIEVDGKFYKKENGKFRSLSNTIKQDSSGGGEFKLLVEKSIFSQLSADFRKDSNLDDYWKLMNDDEIRKVSESKYVGIGSHGYYHNNLGNLANNTAVQEVSKSKQLLESIIQKQVDSIAYPDGSYTNKLLEDVFKLGFKTQFLFGAADQTYQNIPGVYDREGMYPNASSNHEIFYKLVNGKTNRTI